MKLPFKPKILADSTSWVGTRITTMMIPFPVCLLAELNKHSVLKNSANSCLSGDTIITIDSPSALKKNKRMKHTRTTIKDIVDKWYNGNSLGRDMKSRLKELNLRCLNEDTGEYTSTKITNCFKSGIKDVYEIELENGYKLKCSKEHRLYTENGWQTLETMGLNTSINNIVSWNNNSPKIATNGFTLTKEWIISEKDKGKNLTTICKENELNFKNVSYFCEQNKIRFRKPIIENESLLYKDYDWLKEKIEQGLFSPEIAKLCNSTIDRVKKSTRKLGLNGNKFDWSDLGKPWNKGKAYHHSGEGLLNIQNGAKKRIKKNTYKNYKTIDSQVTRFLGESRIEIMEKYNYKCQLSGLNHKLELHHIDPIWHNLDKAFDIDNLIPITKPLHRLIHNKNLDLEFLNWYNDGKDLKEFLKIHKDLKIKHEEISKPKPTGNKLVVRYSKIKSVKYIGKEETYDLEVSGNYHNFIANGIVVHNSRAIPIERYIQNVQDCPYIPIFTGKQKGMQGKQLTKEEIKIAEQAWLEFLNGCESKLDISIDLAMQVDNNKSDFVVDYHKNGVIDMINFMKEQDIHKQNANRLLASFAFTSVVITGTDWDNFFNLRCPKYHYEPESIYYKSKKEFINKWNSCFSDSKNTSNFDWQSINQSYAQPEFQYIAELMYDLYNESTPTYLEEGQWHIPFKDVKLIEEPLNDFETRVKENGKGLIFRTIFHADENLLKVSASCCAKQSYDNAERDESLDKHIERHDKLIEDKHMGVFEHQARVPTNEELRMDFTERWIIAKDLFTNIETPIFTKGKYVSNLKGWIQYRKVIEDLQTNKGN